MTLRNIYFGYMALVGVACGAVLVLAPQAGEFFIPPYFWVLIAVGLFDGAIYLVKRASPAGMLTTQARAIGFVIGMAVVVGITMLAGSPVKFL